MGPGASSAPRRSPSVASRLDATFTPRAHRDANLWFGLLTDLGDADREHVDGDEALLERAAAGIEELNVKYGDRSDGRFFLFHRPRLHNPREGC